MDPLLLLDDVFSELDPGRAERLLALLPAGQTLVTTASPLPSAMTPAAVVDLAGARVRRRDEEPARLGDVLDALASGGCGKRRPALDRRGARALGVARRRRARRVCRPEFVRSSTLVVSAPTGAHAQRVRARSATILAGLADLPGRRPDVAEKWSSESPSEGRPEGAGATVGD